MKKESDSPSRGPVKAAHGDSGELDLDLAGAIVDKIAIAMVAREVDRTSDLLMRHIAASARAVESTIETLKAQAAARHGQ